mgnify:CR=1 FL=1
MKSTLDLVDIVWQKLQAGALKAAISGDIHKHRRPANSQLEDVVINSLPISSQQMQEAIVNVNIHVPNISIAVNGAVDNTQPDHERLKTLVPLAVADLSDTWGDDYNFDVQQQVLIEDREAKDFYINIRLEFFNVNIST